MPTLTLSRAEADSGNLPAVCLRCGAPATGFDRKRFAWHPPWVFALIFFPLPMIIVALILTKRMSVRAPFCAQHHKHWTRRNWLIGGSLLVLALLVAGGFVLAAANVLPQVDAGLVCGSILVAGLVWLVFAAVLHFTGIQAQEITDTHITLNKVADGFREAVRQQRVLQARSWSPEDFIVRPSSSAGCSAVPVVVMVVVALIIVVCLAAITTVGERANNTFTTIGNSLPVVDNAHRFQLNAPGQRWRLLSAAEARKENRRALAAAQIGEGEVLGMVLAEPTDEGVVVAGREDAVAREMFDENTMPNKRIESIQALTFRGQKAVRFRFTGTEGLRQVRIDNTVFIYDGKFYQLWCVGWAVDMKADGSTVQPFLDAFQLLPATEQPKE